MNFEFTGKHFVSIAIVILMNGLLQPASAQNHGPMVTEEDFHRAMDELSNWGRWGDDDELGAANLITPEKRKQAAKTLQTAPRLCP